LLALFAAFVDIIMHRRGPEDLPASRFLLLLVLLLYLLVGLAVLRVSESWPRATAILALDASLYLIFIRLLLIASGVPLRFLQTTIALLGVAALFNLAALPFLLWLETAQDNGVLPFFPYASLVVLLLWSLDVSAFILARAMSRAYVASVAIVIGYFLFSLLVRAAVFPPEG
jgi:hypothetical protein